MFLRKFFTKLPLNLMGSSRFSSSPAVSSHDSHEVSDHSHSSHGHGHHVKEYDWRDDPKVNKELEEDIRDRGWNPEEYTTPYSGTMQWHHVFPENYDSSNLKQNFFPERKKNEQRRNPMRVL